jgi:hypothetical protein
MDSSSFFTFKVSPLTPVFLSPKTFLVFPKQLNAFEQAAARYFTHEPLRVVQYCVEPKVLTENTKKFNFQLTFQ